MENAKDNGGSASGTFPPNRWWRCFWGTSAGGGNPIDDQRLPNLSGRGTGPDIGKTFVEFELIMPQFIDSAWKAGHETFVEENGTLHLQNLTICLAFPWLRDIPGVTVED